MDYHFTREEILKAMDYLDQHPEKFKGRQSTTYNLVYQGKEYPPILVLSVANELKGNQELLLRDFSNSTVKAFYHFNRNGFEIELKKK